MASTLTIRCANDPKDYSLWDSHKETFRRLFLTEGSSLADVKAKMEADFGFPVTNVKTYEVVLREHFKFRKKLEAGQWLLVGQILDRQRQKGLDCVVNLSGTPLDSRLVLKNIRRERRDVTRGRLKPSTCSELPSYLEITPQASLEPAPALRESWIPTSIPGTALSSKLVAEATEISTAAPTLSLRPFLSETQVSIGTISMNEVILQNIIQTPLTRVYDELRKTVPSKQLAQLIGHYLQGDILSVDDKLMLAEVLHGLIYMIRNYVPPTSSQPLQKPWIFGMNSSIAILETACFELSNNRHGIGDGLINANITWSYDIRRPVGNWIADVADPVLLQKFFGLQQPAVAAAWRKLYSYSAFRNRKAKRILMEVALRLQRGDWLRPGSRQHLLHAIVTGDEDTTACMLDMWQNCIGHKHPPMLSKIFLEEHKRGDSGLPYKLTRQNLVASIKLLLRQSVRHNISLQDLDIICGLLVPKCHGHYVEVFDWLLKEGTQLHSAISDWVPPSAELLPANWALICGPSSMNEFEMYVLYWGRFCKDPMLCSTLMKRLVSMWACVVAAKSGPEPLQHFTGALDDHTPQALDRLQQMALMEVVGQGDVKTTMLFLETGVDPEVKLLPRKEWKMPPIYPTCYLDPLSRAASNGNIQLLRAILSHSAYGHRHIIEALVAASYTGGLDHNRKYATVHDTDKRTQADTVAFLLSTGVKGVWEGIWATSARRCKGLVLDYIQWQVDHSVQPCTILSRVFPHDTLRQAIKHGLGLKAVESLVASGLGIHSEQDQHGNTLLIDALLSAPRDKYQLVHFLLRRGADPRTNGLYLTVLEAALWHTKSVRDGDSHLTIGPSTWELGWDEHCKVALDLFKDLLELGASINRDSDRIKPCSTPLLAFLIEARADLSLVKQAVASGIKVNDPREEHNTTPLWSAVKTVQKEVAGWLIEQGADVNASGVNLWIGAAILSYSYKFGTSFMQLLAEKGANLDPPGFPNFLSPLKHALIDSNIDVAIVLLAHGLNLNKSRGWDFAVDDAAKYGALDILKLFVESGGESIYPGISGFDKAFYYAYYRGYTGILMYLEQHTGWATSGVISSLKAERKELGRWPWPSMPE